MIDIFKCRVKNIKDLIMKVQIVQVSDHVYYRHPELSVDRYPWSVASIDISIDILIDS